MFIFLFLLADTLSNTLNLKTLKISKLTNKLNIKNSSYQIKCLILKNYSIFVLVQYFQKLHFHVLHKDGNQLKNDKKFQSNLIL